MPLSDNPILSRCVVCDSAPLEVFLEIQNVPIFCNILCSTMDAALQVPSADIRLGFCSKCGHIQNLAFDTELVKYSQNYENSLHFSKRFQDYIRALANRLVTQYNLYDKEIIEIGCGQGEFLRELCEIGNNRGIGFDTSIRLDQGNHNNENRIEYVRDIYSDQYTDRKADLICCRHVLEHLPNPHDFLSVLRGSIEGRPNAIMYIEVPNIGFTLRELAIWDIIYEHCSYFSLASLSRLCRSGGLKICEATESYKRQFLCIDATVGSFSLPLIDQSHKPSDLIDNIKTFAEQYRSKKELWQDNIAEIRKKKQRPVVWGAGSKGVTFLNMLNIHHTIEFVIDISPRKQGMFISGSGQQIMRPNFLQEYRPDIVFVMNPIYIDEIQEMLGDLGVNAKIITV